MKRITFFVLLFLPLLLTAQQTINLYPATIPNSKPYKMKEIVMQINGQFNGYRSISEPTLTICLPEKSIATGAAVVICPGGGYGVNCFQGEGNNIAEVFIRKGIAAFILKYRLPSDSIMVDKSIGPLQDAQQAIKTVRQRAAEWNINPAKIGIMGFSAGGHLASTAGTHFDKSYIPNNEKISLRPDFMILVYPVISMKNEIKETGTHDRLLGKSPNAEQIMLFSNEMQVNANTPPTWITHTGDDKIVPVENSIRFYQALIKNNVPAEMHLYPKGNHGFVLHIPTEKWMQPVFDWMKKGGIIR
ncbi:MAG: alpha/beta hydrolase [Bacteroidales bacterium]|nr:alpha/beta hydrolase [Bacteroidales bacterium]